MAHYMELWDALIEYAEDRNISYDTNLARDYAKYMVEKIASEKGK